MFGLAVEVELLSHGFESIKHGLVGKNDDRMFYIKIRSL